MKKLWTGAIAIALNLPATAQTIPSSIADRATTQAQEIGARTPPAPYGCVVLLCLSNPQGPTAVAQCVDPIRQLWAELRRGKAFPACEMAKGPNGGAEARMRSTMYADCPQGTIPLQAGELAMGARLITVQSHGNDEPITPDPDRFAAVGIGSGDDYLPNIESGTWPPKVCVTRPIGVGHLARDEATITVTRYDELVILPAQGLRRYVDVSIDAGDGRGQIPWRRVWIDQ